MNNSHSPLDTNFQELAPDTTGIHKLRIKIPKCSFTAFRLSSGTSKEISHLATTTFLGKIPDAWIRLSIKTPLLARGATRRPSTKDWILGTSAGVKARTAKYASLRSPVTRNAYMSLGDISSTDTESISSRSGEYYPEINLDTRSIDSRIFDELLHRKADKVGSANSSGDTVSLSKVSDHTQKVGIYEEKPRTEETGAVRNSFKSPKVVEIRLQSNETLAEKPSGVSILANSSHALQVSAQPKPILRSDPEEFQLRHFRSSVHENDLASQDAQLEHGTYVSSSIDENCSAHACCEPQKVVSDKSRGTKQKVMFVSPSPEEPSSHERLKREYIMAEKEHHRSLRKMQSMARKSRKLARHRSSKLKIKLADNSLRKWGAGEIIRVDKMLVMIKKIYNVKSVSSCTEGSDFNSFVHDHWREYEVVLRVNDVPFQPMSIQLFEVGKKNDYKGAPEYAFHLSKQVTADFFSHTDKTISVTYLDGDEMMIYIFNPKHISKAYKWLHTIKEVMGEDYYSVVNVSLGDKSTKFKVNIPRKLLKKSLTGSDFMILHKQLTGYTVETDAYFRYAKSRIESCLESMVEVRNDLREWKQNNPNPGFCLKIHDRIEWVPTNAEALVMRTHLLREHATLEFREKSNNCLTWGVHSDKTIPRPHPIEGFLSRISDHSGTSNCRVRAIYKVQYFLSSDNILFFSSFRRGMPPSPQNEFLVDGVDKEGLAKQLPEIYIRNPLALDKNQHIPWLEGAEFEKLDDEAVGEFSRRLQQILNAKAVVDLSIVSSIRPIPFHQIQSRHLYFQSYMWYSSATIIDDMSLMDSGFEIKFDNGSSLQLLAPSQGIRDEWIERLGSLTSYWRNRESQSCTRHSVVPKCSVIGADECHDTTIRSIKSSQESGKSNASSDIYSNAGLAASTCILRSGYLYQKQKKHASFSNFFVVLCPGYLSIFSVFKRARFIGDSKVAPYFERYSTIPISECYIYSGVSTKLDLVPSHNTKSPTECDVPKLYPSGWKSSEEEYTRCFSVWFGGKRALRHGARDSKESYVKVPPAPKNPGILRMARRSGMTGKVFVFIAPSEQERNYWVSSILQEIDRFSGD